jgi:hypothetical protein
MLFHFIKRDIQNFQVFWGLLGLVYLLGIVVCQTSPEFLVVLTYFAFVFGVLPLNHLMGSNWKSGRILSRSYMLALPIHRHKQFALLQLRALVFWMPFFISFTLSYFMTQSVRDILPMTQLAAFEVFPAILVLVFWLNNSLIHIVLTWERVSKIPNPIHRLRSWTVFFCLGIFEFSLIWLWQSDEVVGRQFFSLGTVLVLFVASVRFRQARGHWTSVS